MASNKAWQSAVVARGVRRAASQSPAKTTSTTLAATMVMVMPRWLEDRGGGGLVVTG